MKIWCWLVLFSPKLWSQVNHPSSPSAEPADNQWGIWFAVFSFQRLLEWLSPWLILFPKWHQSERLQQTHSSLADTLILWKCHSHSASSRGTAPWLGSRSCEFPCEGWHHFCLVFAVATDRHATPYCGCRRLGWQMKGSFYLVTCPSDICIEQVCAHPGPPSPTPRPYTNKDVLQFLCNTTKGPPVVLWIYKTELSNVEPKGWML